MKLTIIIETGKPLFSEFTGTINEMQLLQQFEVSYHADELNKAISKADSKVASPVPEPAGA